MNLKACSSLDSIFVDANLFLDYAIPEPAFGRDYNLLPNDALHLAVMRRMQIVNIATRDSDFERADEIVVWSQ